MINLLPQYWKNKLADEEVCKTAAILGIVTSAAVLVFILMMIMEKVFYQADLDMINVAIAEKMQEMKIYNVELIEKAVSADSSLIMKVSDFYKGQVKVSGIFLQVARSLPAGIKLSDFNYSAGRVDLRGFSPDRETLVAFRNALEKDQSFDNVVFPPENWLTAEKIDFEVTFDYVQP